MNNKMASYSFRFQNLDIWKKAVEIGMELFDIADELDRKHLYRFAEQLRASALSMSNNIAEGSGSTSKKRIQPISQCSQKIDLRKCQYDDYLSNETTDIWRAEGAPFGGIG